MEHFNKVCSHVNVIVALNADKEKYLNYETSTSGSTIGNVCMHCHDSKELNFFGVPKKFNSYDGGYARLRSPEMIALKENANIKIIVDEEGHLLASACGNMLPIVTPHRQLSGISIQRKIKRRHAYSSTNIINHILSTCRNCYLCKNNVVIDSEIAGKIKRALAENITKEYKDESMKNKVPANVTTINQTINEPNNSKDEVHIEHVDDPPLEMCSHASVIVALNADKEKYLNYETSTSGSTIGNVCVRCHDTMELNFFGVPKKFNYTNGGYGKVSFPEMLVLKENANIKIIVDEEGYLLASASGNMLPIDRTYRHLLGISIQMKAKGKRKAYSSTNIINHILSTCRNCYLCKNNVIIDSEIARKIKRVLSENITMEYKDETMKNKAPANVTGIDQTVNESNNTKDEKHIEPVHETPVKIVYDSKWNNDYSTDYELREDNNYNIKREHGEPFYGTDSKCPKLIIDINNVS